MVIERIIGVGLSPDCGEALWKIGGKTHSYSFRFTGPNPSEA